MRFFIFSATGSINVDVGVCTGVNIGFGEASSTSLTLFFPFGVLVLPCLKRFKKAL